MKTPSFLSKIFRYIDNHESIYIDRLREAIEIRSVTTSVAYQNDVRKMVDWITVQLQNNGFHVTVPKLNTQGIKDPQLPKYWPIILADLFVDTSKKTLLICSNLDVQFSDGTSWKYDPFKMTLDENKLYGKGTANNKSAILCWLHAIEAYQATCEALPVNIKIILHFSETTQVERIREALEQLIKLEKNRFFNDVDYICIGAGYSLNRNHPCIIYDGIYKQVNSIDLDTIKTFAKLDLDFDYLKRVMGVKRLPYSENKIEFLTRWWKFPSFCVHGIEGVSCDSIDRLSIPSTVTGTFSIQLVPNQTIEETKRVILNHIYDKWQTRSSSNRCNVVMDYAVPCWIADIHDPNITAAMHASEFVYNKTPTLVCEGFMVPIASCLHDILKRSLVVIPICSIECAAHSVNEFIDVESYIKGVGILIYSHVISNALERIMIRI
ncbi:hypothetical protein FQR65_LT02042 [Abscondita terminalis]|nr:hypothetical protein FQR65_LT02042 [Abscondita terminalis]